MHLNSTPLMAGTVWRHYKGGRYLVIALAETHHHHGDIDVVYVSLKYGTYCTRPMTRDSRNEDSWDDLVQWPDGVQRCRFVHDDHQESGIFKKMFPAENKT